MTGTAFDESPRGLGLDTKGLLVVPSYMIVFGNAAEVACSPSHEWNG